VNYELLQYTPHVMIALCISLMIGLQLPNTQRPSTWHMTMLIVGIFSFLNILLSPIYDFVSEFGSLSTYAYMYTVVAVMDAICAYFVIMFAQKGREVITAILSLFILANVAVIVNILIKVTGFSDMTPFSQILFATDTIYYNYLGVIFTLNLLQFAILLGGSSGWNTRNITKLYRQFSSFVAGGGSVVRGGNRLMVCCSRTTNKKTPQ